MLTRFPMKPLQDRWASAGLAKQSTVGVCPVGLATAGEALGAAPGCAPRNCRRPADTLTTSLRRPRAPSETPKAYVYLRNLEFLPAARPAAPKPVYAVM